MVAASVREAGDCAICAAAASISQRPVPGPNAVYVDDVIIAFVKPDVQGALIAPRQHIEPLSTTPEFAGRVLAGIRRASVAVQVYYGASGVSVEPMSAFPRAQGHACFRVMPTLPTLVETRGDQLEMLVSALRGVLASKAARLHGPAPPRAD